MKKMILCLALAFVFCFCSPAYAYLDPGSGSMLVSALIGIVATLFFLIKGVYYKGTDFFYSLIGRTKKRKKESLVFWSEGKEYWNTFFPVLKVLSERGESCTYLTSGEDDPGLFCKLPYVTSRFIGKGNKAFSKLNMLEADLCILTTPGLDVLQIRRSPGVKHYVHIVHALSDMASYKMFSFDYYDSILCSGDYQMKSLRKLEELRKTQIKELFKSGCPYFDVLVAEIKEKQRMMFGEKSSDKLQILIAPTWNKNGLLSRYGMSLLEPLAESGEEICIRPHPQSTVSEQDLLYDLQQKLKKYENVSWNFERDGLAAMSRADVLISDYSGIIFDFAFLMEKPVLTLTADVNMRGFDGNDLPWQAWELTVLDLLGRKISLEDIPKLPQIVKEVIGDSNFLFNIRKLRDENVFNFGKSGPVIAEQLLQIREKIVLAK